MWKRVVKCCQEQKNLKQIMELCILQNTKKNIYQVLRMKLQHVKIL